MLLTALSSFNLALIIPLLANNISENLLNNGLIIRLSNFLDINSTNDLIFPLTFIFIFSILLSSLIKLITLFLSHRISALIGSDISSKGLSQIIYQPYEWHIYKNSSELIATLTNSVNKTVSFVSGSLQLITSFLIILVMSLSLFVVEPEIFITALLIIIFSYLVMVFTVKEAGKLIKL